MSRSSLHAIRWVAFDAVGTLIYPDPPVAVVYAATARRFGSRLTEEDIRSRFAEAFVRSEVEDVSPADWTQAGVLRTSEDRERRRWLEIVSRVIDDADPPACFAELFSHFARPDSWRCYPDVAETLRGLAERGCRLAIVSNFDDRLNAICDGLQELERVELRIISSLVGYRKPSARFYSALIAAAGCESGEVLVVGDDEVNDVQGARAAGMRAIWLVRGAARQDGTIGDLRELLSADELAGPDAAGELA